jgi:type IV secretion system protein VirB10
MAERKRREYESLFATNVVLTRRPDSDPIASGTAARGSVPAVGSGDAQAPSVDDIADAVVRATVRASAVSQGATASGSAQAVTPPATATAKVPEPDSPKRRTRTGAISAAGPMHRLLEGTLIDTVLTNRLDGGSAGPVNCLVTNAVYSHSGQQVLIPAGAHLLGETKPVQSLGETRLAVTFHRLVMPDGSTYVLDDFLGTNQIGDAGLRDRVNHHYWSTFGVAGAVGLISGLAQYLGTLGLSRGDGDRTLVIAGSTSDATSQASLQVMNRFLNRLPTITIREGHRIKVYLTSDLELPAYDAPAVAGQS